MPKEACPFCGGNFSEVECRCPMCGTRDNGSAPSRKSIVLTPEFLVRAKQEFTEEEMIAGIDEIERTGGLKLEDFIHELEAEVYSTRSFLTHFGNSLTPV